MQFEYEISEQDFLDGQRLALRNSPSIRWTRLALPLFGVVLLAFWIQSTAKYGFTLRATLGLIFPLLFLSLPFLTKWNAKKMYAKGTSLHGNLQLDVSDDGLTSAGSTFSGKTQWSNYSRFFENEKCFILYQNTQVFNIIPKRHLSADQINNLRDYFNQKIGNNKT
jgi:hypothetical protein